MLRYKRNKTRYVRLLLGNSQIQGDQINSTLHQGLITQLFSFKCITSCVLFFNYSLIILNLAFGELVSPGSRQLSFSVHVKFADMFRKL